MGRRPATVSSLLTFRQLLIILGALAGAGGLQGARKHVQDEEEALEAAAIAKMQRRGRSARDTSMKLALAPTAGDGPRKPNALRIQEGFNKFDRDGSGDIDIEELERYFNAATSTSMMRDMDSGWLVCWYVGMLVG